MSNSRTFLMNSQTLNAQKIHPYFGRSVMTEFMYAYDQKYRSICPNSRTFKDLYKNSRTFQAWNPNFQIPGLSRFSMTCANPVHRLRQQYGQKVSFFFLMRVASYSELNRFSPAQWVKLCVFSGKTWDSIVKTSFQLYQQKLNTAKYEKHEKLKRIC